MSKYFNTKEEIIEEIIKDLEKGLPCMIGVSQQVSSIVKKDNKYIIYRNNIHNLLFETDSEEDIKKFLRNCMTM